MNIRVVNHFLAFLFFIVSIGTSYGQCNFTITPGAASYGCYSTLEDVVWTSQVNTTATGNNLSKSAGGTAWNAGAVSTARVYNNGYAETVINEVNTNRMFGLSNVNPDVNFTSLQFAVYLRNNGSLDIFESGTSRGNFGTYATGDTIRVKVERGRVRYYRNSTLVYSSNVLPTLPLMVDVSLNSSGSTIGKAVIGNLSNGSFTTLVGGTGAGASPTYQWKLNGVDVGTNSASYSNSSLANNDVLTCVLTPGAGGCSVPPVTSNTVRIALRNAYDFGDFYIRGTPAAAACNRGIERVVWDSTTTNLRPTGNSLIKIQSNGNWDGGAASLNTVSNYGYLEFTATETNRARYVGLSQSNPDNLNTSIQFAFYLLNNGTLQIHESGVNRGTFGTYATNDVLRIAVEDNKVMYYDNGTLLYISTLTPTLPLRVDVSINATGGTVTNAVVSNYSAGTFTAVATNAGASPTYQWQLNGVNVGTNSSTYTNTALSANDVITCRLSPGLNGCTAAQYTSNSITYSPLTNPAAIQFYIQGSAAVNACNSAEEEVRWRSSSLNFVVPTGGNLSKFQSNGNWDGGAASWNTVQNNGYFQFSATEVNMARMAGLSATDVDFNFTGIQYAFYLQNNGALQIYESGTSRGTFGTYASTDLLKIAVESGVVKYYRNGVLLYISTVSPSLPLLVDVSIRDVGGTITNPLVSNYSVGAFTATAINAGVAPTYQWYLNGSPVGVNANSYTNTSLTNNDVVTCALTPDLTGCSSSLISSNSVTYKYLTAPVATDFYITGGVAASSCNMASENVRWKTSDLVNVLATSNNLSKFQSNGNWNGGAASWNTVDNNGYLVFSTAEVITNKVVGLSSTNAGSDQNTIQFGFSLTSAAALNIIESGTGRGNFGTYAPGDQLKISVESYVVKYYKNGTLLYISTVTPTLPLLVDVSINNTNGTVTNAVVSNYTTGTYLATATNAGASPSYQWQLNGLNVGINSNTYTNNSLTNGDLITCILTPDIVGCSTLNQTSNTITNTVVTTNNSIDFFIQGNVSAAACSEGMEEVVWKVSDLTNVRANTNNLTKIQSGGNWDGGASSWNTVNNNGYLQFTAAEITTNRMIGLSTSNLGSDFATIQYAIYLQSNNNFQIYESGTSRGTFGTYTTNDVFKVTVEAGVVKYYHNGSLLYISNVAPTLPMVVDVSINSTGGTVSNAYVVNYNDGSFTAIALNAGAAPTFQWVLNGGNVGTNSNTYSNPAMVAGDVLTCIITPDLPGCSGSTYTSNAITYSAVANPISVELYVKTSVAVGTCAVAEENVRWKVSEFAKVEGSGNNLIKIQSGGNWNGGAASWNTVSDNGYFKFTAAESNRARMVGLSNTNVDADYVTIQYAFYLQSNATFNVYESGVNRGNFGAYASNDTFKIAVESGVVKYYRNSVLVFSSAVPPVLPLLVDVSINSLDGTVTDAVISNLTAGTFQAIVNNAGATPTYQWKLNGVNVGTNSSTYTNTSLNDNDYITCAVTPSLGGCSVSSINSDTIFYRTILIPTSVDFYISGTVGSTTCNNLVLEDVQWRRTDLANVQASTNNLTKVTSGGVWDGGAASWNRVSNDGYFSFVATETNRARMAGLSATNTNANFNTIQYAIYLQSNGSLSVYESGANRGTFGTYVANDTFKIAVEANVVKYYKNGVILYVSNIVPTLPLLVDVSINSVGGTITNAVVANLNAGTFTATAINTGASPSYQWKLNGVNVGTNSTTYVNTSLSTTDVLTCVLSPNTGACTAPTINANELRFSNGTVSNNTEIYITGAVVVSSCYESTENVQWKKSDLNFLLATQNKVYKQASNGNWDGGAASWNTVSNNGYFQFTPLETNRAKAAGLSTTNANNNFTSIQFAFFLTNAGGLEIYESGVSRGTFGTYAVNDKLKIAVEAGVVKYYRNGTLLYTSAVVPTLPLLVDVSIRDVGGTVGDAIVGNLNAKTFTATALNAGATPVYQWQLNGVNVGTNSTTYTNTSIVEGDVVECILTPSAGICGTYTSNSIQYNLVTPLPTLEFYIQGTPAASACLSSEEQVVWKKSDLSNVTSTATGLTKTTSNGNWNGGAASWNTVSNNGYLQFTASEINKARMVGLSSTNLDANYTSIAYAFYLRSNNQLSIYEAGANRGVFATYATGDLLKITVESNVVKYYRNGNLLYISTIAPTLPLLVDVSIYDVGGTVTNAVVGNFNTGTFTATAINAGVTPSYQWRLNGANVGTNSATYTNTSLNANDVVSCLLYPSVGCSGVAYPSDTIINRTNTVSTGIDFYIQGTPTTAACLTANENVQWKVTDNVNVQATLNSLSKIQSNGSWNGGAASWNRVSDNGYLLFIATETNRARMVGLSNANANADYTTIEYAFYLQSNSNLQIYELGASRFNAGVYATGDSLKIAVESGVVKYYKNSALIYISLIPPTLPLLVDVSIRDVGGTVTNAIVSNFNTGTFTATAINAGATPSYQWKLNGTNVGTNSASYTNTSLNINDVVTCVLTPGLGGCSAVTYTSNAITNKLVPVPTGIEFYIQGTVATSSCNNLAQENVKWKVSDLSNVNATNNNLVKIQSGGNWNGGAASWNTVANHGYLQFTASETNRARFVGLSTSNTNSSNTSIQYAFNLQSNSALGIFESGTNRGNFGTYATNDVLRIAVVSGVVMYYRNGTLLYTSAVVPTLPLLVDVSINSLGGTVTNAIVVNNNAGSFTATASNAGAAPTYQWKLNGTNVGTNSATYVNPFLAINDVVTCQLTPDLGGCSAVQYTSNTIRMIASPPPVITTQPVAQTVCVGSPASFSAVVTGTNLTYQWRKNGVDIPGATLTSYSIASATALDAGNYDLMIISGGCASVTSNVVALTVNTAPAITTQPASQTSCVGAGPVTFSVVATGTNLLYQWRKNGVDISGATSSTYTITTPVVGDAGNYTVLVSNTGCTSVLSSVAILTMNAGFTWNGSVSTDWFNTSNWTCGIVPTSTNDVIIPASMPRYPVITTASTAQARGISIALGASVTLTDRTSVLQVYGDWTNQGTFTPNTGRVEFKGSAATQTITASSGKERFFGLTIDKTSGSAVISGSTAVDINAGGTLHVLSGQMNLNSRPLVLKSAPNGSYNDGTYTHSLDSTARLGTVTGTLANATNFSIERYISAPAVKPRLLATSVQNMPAAQWADSISIFGGNFRPLPGFPSSTSTLYTYNEPLSFGTLSRGLSAITNKNTILQPGQGYRIIVGYDNNPAYTSPAKPAITVKMTGVPFTGSLNMPVTKSGGDPYGWNLLGNPYSCELNWTDVYNDNAANLSATVAIMDPRASGTSDYYYYNAVTNTAIDPRYSVGLAPSTYGTSPRYNQNLIASSQGFFVFKTTAGSGTVSFAESQKEVAPGMQESNFRTSSDPISRLNVITIASTGYSDNTYLFFVDDADKGSFDAKYDAYKFSNTNVSISTNTFGKELAMNGMRDQVADNDIPLIITTKAMGIHTIMIKDLETLPSSKEVYLIDHYTNITTQLTALSNTYNYEFSADTFSTSKSRFVLRVVTNTRVTGLQQADGNNALMIYPNPSVGQITLSLADATPGEYKVEITNAQGKVVYEQQASFTAGGKVTISNLDQQLISGVYTVKVTGENQTYTEKLVLVK